MAPCRAAEGLRVLVHHHLLAGHAAFRQALAKPLAAGGFQHLLALLGQTLRVSSGFAGRAGLLPPARWWPRPPPRAQRQLAGFLLRGQAGGST